MTPIQAQAAAQAVLASPDAAEIFRAGFHWLEDRLTGVLDVWKQREAHMPVRQSPAFRDVHQQFDTLLRGAIRINSGDLNIAVLRRLREILTTLLSEANTEAEAGVAVLALLIAIEDGYGHAIRSAYYKVPRAQNSVGLKPGRTAPKPPPAFGTANTPFAELAPATGVDGRKLFLAHQFYRLTVQDRGRDLLGLRPALHRSSAISTAGAPRNWRIAVVDVLSGIDELRRDDPTNVNFALPAYVSDAVEVQIAARVDWAMEVCREEGAHLIVVPELTLSRRLVNRIALRLDPWPTATPDGLIPMVVAGCLHETAPDNPARFRNRPAVVTPIGELAWDYWKRRPFTATMWEGREELFGAMCDSLVAIDTPLGRVAVTICLDFLDVDVQDALRKLQATLVVVPAMTASGPADRTFVPRAEVLTSEQHAATVFANSTVPLRLEAAGGTPSPAPKLSFVTSSTRIASGTPLCADVFGSTQCAATVCMYHIESELSDSGVGSRLSIRNQPPVHCPF